FSDMSYFACCAFRRAPAFPSSISCRICRSNVRRTSCNSLSIFPISSALYASLYRSSFWIFSFFSSNSLMRFFRSALNALILFTMNTASQNNFVDQMQAIIEDQPLNVRGLHRLGPKMPVQCFLVRVLKVEVDRNPRIHPSHLRRFDIMPLKKFGPRPRRGCENPSAAEEGEKAPKTPARGKERAERWRNLSRLCSDDLSTN